MTFWISPFLLQGAAIAIDEFYFHHRREIPLWERVGHPVDTLSLCLCLAWTIGVSYSESTLTVYAGLAALSCLLVTKDEWVHARLCDPRELWLHSVLFLLHPFVLISIGWIWAHPPLYKANHTALLAFFGVAGTFFLYQVLYWNLFSKSGAKPSTINNAFYDELGDRWYTADDDPIALLRAEGEVKHPWVIRRIANLGETESARILDIACGAGFLANTLARAGHRVTGLDRSAMSLAAARRHDSTGTVQYVEGDAGQLPFADASFDVVCCMDFLEHVEEPFAIVKEAARVLKPGGLFFFHTFNRGFLSWLLAVKGLEWFVQNAPKDIHVYRLLIRPTELTEMCERLGLHVETIVGVRPVVLTPAFFKLLATGRVDPNFRFKLTRSQRVGYLGVAVYRPNLSSS